MSAPHLENRLPDEGINTSDEHPLREFAWVVGAGLLVFAVILVLTTWLAGWAAPKTPFKYEVQLAERVGLGKLDPEHASQHQALQALADRLIAKMDLPAGMTIKVSFNPSSTVNAYATIGGHVVVYGGLLSKLPSEAALATLLAHEIGHVKHRHVAASMGRGMGVALVLSLLSADAGGKIAQSVFGASSQLALMNYSREHENQADEEALRATVALYGHGAGYMELFEVLQKEESKLPEAMRSVGVFRSHPLTEDRLAQARSLAQTNGWSLQGSSAALADALKQLPKPTQSQK